MDARLLLDTGAGLDFLLYDDTHFPRLLNVETCSLRVKLADSSIRHVERRSNFPLQIRRHYGWGDTHHRCLYLLPQVSRGPLSDCPVIIAGRVFLRDLNISINSGENRVLLDGDELPLAQVPTTSSRCSSCSQSECEDCICLSCPDSLWKVLDKKAADIDFSTVSGIDDKSEPALYERISLPSPSQEEMIIPFDAVPTICTDLLNRLVSRGWQPMRNCPNWVARLRELAADEVWDDPRQSHVFELRCDSSRGEHHFSIPSSVRRSGKALDVTTDHSLSRLGDSLSHPIRKYVDDMAVHNDDVAKVCQTLAEDGFVVKPPQSLLGSKVIGIHITPAGEWVRKKPLDLDVVPQTRSQLASLTGKLATYYPIASWLRLCGAMLTRVAAAAQPSVGSKRSYDYPLPPQLQDLWVAVCEHIKREGDPCHGRWLVNPDLEWRLFTDGSAIGMAATIFFGPIKVEDRAWLRKKGCKRHINVVETEAVLRGMNLVTDYMRAYDRRAQVLHLYTDNASVQSWLTRKDGRHWGKISGMSKIAIEGRLQLIDDIRASFGIELHVHHCRSCDNEADQPSRLPEALLPAFTAAAKAVESEVNPPAGSPCDAAGQRFTFVSAAEGAEADRSEELAQFLTEFDIQDRKVQVPRDKAQELLELAHDHEGRAAMFNILREFVDMPGLAAECNQFKCADCAAAKAFPGDNNPLIPLASIKPAPRPFDRIHTDICGPYRQMDSGTSRFYLITAIDSCTNYVAIRPCLYQPTAADVQDHLQSMVDTFQRRPLLVQSDRGSQYTAKSIEKLFEQWNTVHILSARHSSHSNGKIERWHRYANEYLRAHSPSTLSYGEFCRNATKAARTYNITPRKGPGSSPHEQVFRFRPSFRPEVPLQCHESYEYLREVLRDPPKDSIKPRLPLLVRVTGIVPKLQRRWMPAVVLNREGTNRISVKLDDGSETIVHTMDVKLL